MSFVSTLAHVILRPLMPYLRNAPMLAPLSPVTLRACFFHPQHTDPAKPPDHHTRLCTASGDSAIIMISTSPRTFLDIPLELRLLIYRQVVTRAMAAGAPAEMYGMYLACRTLHQEI
jgi:hypothetical protein